MDPGSPTRARLFVIAAPSGPSAIVATKWEPRESALTGMHGSLTQADQLVPLLTLTVS